jgi:hypothetical protein
MSIFDGNKKLVEKIPELTNSINMINVNLLSLIKRLDWLVLSLSMIFFFQMITSFLIKPTFQIRQDNKIDYKIEKFL